MTMRELRRLSLVVLPLTAGALALATGSNSWGRMIMSRGQMSAPIFALENLAIGGMKSAADTPAYASSNTIATISDGNMAVGTIAIDEDSGDLVRADRNGKLLARLEIGAGASQLVYDPQAKIAYVTDRRGDRVVAVSVTATELTQLRTIATDAEPFGIALSPDRQTLMISAITDRTLTAVDPTTGKTKWKRALSAEPRGIAISADGKRAAIAYLQTGTVDYLSLGAEASAVRHVPLGTAGAQNRRFVGQKDVPSFARASFAVQFLGNDIAMVPFQRETPVQDRVSENTGSYGGGFEAPITQQLAFVGLGTEHLSQAVAQIGNHQVHAMAWDSKTDTLYLAGLGNDTIVAVADASKDSVHALATTNLSNGVERCGPKGIAVGNDGSVSVWCSFKRSVTTVNTSAKIGATFGKPAHGPSLVATKMSDEQHQGFVAFHSADAHTSAGGAMACSSCHPDGRADGLTWRIEKHELQTPVLAGRVLGTHPYKWDGGDKDIQTSLTSTVRRLGGVGIDAKAAKALAAYVEALPRPRAPKRDADQVARGKAVFASDAAGCASCHSGKLYTDNDTHPLGGTLNNVDTPSLVGLYAGAPYYHDGSAATLPSMLRNHGAVYGMAETEKLNAKQISDLTAFLETL
jgi:hypothetical protein